MKHINNLNAQRQVTGLVLAGGKSTRMGRDKALVLYKEKPLVQHVIDAISPVCDEVLVSTNNPDIRLQNVEFVSDNYKNIGPIAGIEAGLRKAKNSILLVVSCDTPLVPTSLFRYMIDCHVGFDVSLAAHNGINEPMIGIYKKEIYSIVNSAIESGLYKPPVIIKKTKWQDVDIHEGLNFYKPDMFKNFNRPEDLFEN